MDPAAAAKFREFVKALGSGGNLAIKDSIGTLAASGSVTTTFATEITNPDEKRAVIYTMLDTLQVMAEERGCRTCNMPGDLTTEVAAVFIAAKPGVVKRTRLQAAAISLYFSFLRLTNAKVDAPQLLAAVKAHVCAKCGPQVTEDADYDAMVVLALGKVAAAEEGRQPGRRGVN